MNILKNIYLYSKDNIIASRLQMIRFNTFYGTEKTKEAYGISKAKIFKWKKKYREKNLENTLKNTLEKKIHPITLPSLNTPDLTLLLKDLIELSKNNG